MPRKPLSDDELREIMRRLAAGEGISALAREFHTTRASIYQAGAEIGGARIARQDDLEAEEEARWRARTTPREIAAGAIIETRGLQAYSKPGVHGSWSHITLDVQELDDLTAKFEATGRLVVDGRLVTEADARAAQMREGWLEVNDW
jgi:hypothetical protein